MAPPPRPRRAPAGAAAPPAAKPLPPPAAGTFPGAAWPTYGRTAARTGVAAGVAAAAGPGGLRISWQAHLDGAVYGQPLLAGNRVIAATENDTIYALNASTGQVSWRTHIGT